MPSETPEETDQSGPSRALTSEGGSVLPINASLLTLHTPIAPSLRFIFRLTSTLAPPTVIGDSGQGIRKVVPLTGGLLESESNGMKGEVAFQGARGLTSGADYLTVDAKGLTRLDARYTFKLRSGHFLYFQSSGTRFVPSVDADATKQLSEGRDIDPRLYYFRLKLILESSDPNPAIQEACNKVIVSSAVRGSTSIVYDAYALD